MTTQTRKPLRRETRNPPSMSDLPPDAQHLLRTLARVVKRQAARPRP